MSKLVLVLSGLALTAAVSAHANQEVTYHVREGMVREIDPPITAIWDMQVEVMDDEGNFDPLLMSDAHWATLTDRAQVLRAAATRMASATDYQAVDWTGDLTSAPEGTDLAAVDARLAANPDAFRAMARTLETHTRQLVEAAEARDAARVTTLVNDLQPVCKACHDAFWYPEEYAQ